MTANTPNNAAATSLAETVELTAAQATAPVAVKARANAAAAREARARWRLQLRAADAAHMDQLRERVLAAPRDTSSRDAMHRFAAELVHRGYTYSAIGRAAMVSSQSAAAWAARGDHPDMSDRFEEDGPHGEVDRASGRLSPTERHPVPDDDQNTLIDLRLRLMADSKDHEAREALDLLCAQLRARGYTLRAIADVMDVTRESVRIFANRVRPEALADLKSEVSRKVPERQIRVTPPPLELTAEEAARARELRPVASRNRAGTSADSDVRRAYEEYMGILFTGKARGVTEYRMAKQIGVTTAAIRHRMQRVTGELPPSMRPTDPADEPRAHPIEPPGVSDERMARLLDLMRAAEIRHGRGANHPGRVEASRQFDVVLADLVDGNGVGLQELANTLSRSRASLAARLSGYTASTRTPDGEDEVRHDDDTDDASPSSTGPSEGDEAPEVRIVAPDGRDPSGSIPAWVEDEDAPGGSGEDDEDLDAVLDPPPDTGVGVGVPERAGRLTDFTPDATPAVPKTPPARVQVDPAAQRASNARHMALMRDLRSAVREGGHSTHAWDLGQDVCFTHGHTLVNVEVKSVSAGVEQYRLGVGQLLEQMQHHIDHIASGSDWYRERDIRDVTGILVVTDNAVAAMWQRLAERLGIAVWPAQRALELFAQPEPAGLPQGASPITLSG